MMSETATEPIQSISKQNLMFGVLGIFFYVGAEVAIGSYLVNYF
jgi:FHS family L-fucose permease-like MFS transporter